MNSLSLNEVVFAATLLFFILLAFWGLRRIKSPMDFFHSHNVTSNISSLTAANVTIGSGLVYLIVGGFQYGYLMFLVPIMTGAGYLLLAAFIRKLVPFEVIDGITFLKGIDSKIEECRGEQSKFGFSVSLSLIVVFTLFLGFEIFAATSILTPTIVESPDTASSIVVAAVVFSVALAYALMGGIAGIFRTDRFQLVAILIFLALTCWSIGGSDSLAGGLGAGNDTDHDPVTASTVIAIISACLAALTTQFYSIINWTSVSHVGLRGQGTVLKWTGLTTALVLSLVVGVGVLLPHVEGTGPIDQLMSMFADVSQNAGLAVKLATVITIVGIMSIVFSTVDSIIIAVSLFFYENISKRDACDRTTDPVALRRIRLIGFCCFAISFSIMLFFNFTKPDVFYLLLTIASGVIVFGPMLATAGYLSAHRDRMRVFNSLAVHFYLALFLVAFILGVIALQWIPAVTPWISASAFVCSAIWSMILLFRSRSSALKA